MEIGEGKERNFHFLLFVRGENRVEGKWGLKSFLSKAHKSLSKMDKKHGENLREAKCQDYPHFSILSTKNTYWKTQIFSIVPLFHRPNQTKPKRALL